MRGLGVGPFGRSMPPATRHMRGELATDDIVRLHALDLYRSWHEDDGLTKERL